MQQYFIIMCHLFSYVLHKPAGYVHVISEVTRNTIGWFCLRTWCNWHLSNKKCMTPINCAIVFFLIAMSTYTSIDSSSNFFIIIIIVKQSQRSLLQECLGQDSIISSVTTHYKYWHLTKAEELYKVYTALKWNEKALINRKSQYRSQKMSWWRLTEIKWSWLKSSCKQTIKMSNYHKLWYKNPQKRQLFFSATLSIRFIAHMEILKKQIALQLIQNMFTV